MLRQLGRQATPHLIMTAHSSTLKLDNQKNGWRGVCIHQEANGESIVCPVRALGRRYLILRAHSNDPKRTMSTFYEKGKQSDVTDKHIRTALKLAASFLRYPA